MKKRRFNTSLYMLTALLTLSACTRQVEEGVQPFDLQTIAGRHSPNTFVDKSDAFDSDALHISPKDGHSGIIIWEKGDAPDWTKAEITNVPPIHY